MTSPASKPVSAQSRFTFQGLATRRVLFEEVEVPGGALSVLAPGQKANVDMELQLNAVPVEEGKKAQVTLTVKLTPDPKVQPYRVEVSLSGIFAPEPGVPDEEFRRFCQINAPVILWPYVRELVHRATADATRGPLRLDPINLTGAFGEAVAHAAEAQSH